MSVTEMSVAMTMKRVAIVIPAPAGIQTTKKRVVTVIPAKARIQAAVRRVLTVIPAKAGIQTTKVIRAAPIILSCLLPLLTPAGPAFAQADLNREQDVMSSMGIVGYDPATGEVGVAAASRVFAAGIYMAHVRAGVGAIALMGGAPYRDGSLMLDWMQDGASPDQVVRRLRQRYPNIGQISIVDVRGRSTAVTNPSSSDWKGHRVGRNYATSGNILAGPEVVAGFADTFERTAGSGLPLAERLLMALEAADRAGGDARGRQGAILQVYKPGAGPFGTDLYVDLRIDDSPNSIADLRHLYERWKVVRNVYGSRMITRSAGQDVQRLQVWLLELGYVERTNREVFDATGQPTGIFNDATAEAVVAFNQAHGLGAARAANRETILKMAEILENRGRGRGTSSAWKP